MEYKVTIHYKYLTFVTADNEAEALEKARNNVDYGDGLDVDDLIETKAEVAPE